MNAIANAAYSLSPQGSGDRRTEGRDSNEEEQSLFSPQAVV